MTMSDNDTTPLSVEEIDAINARNAARTPGRWWPGDGVIHTADVRIAVVNDGLEFGARWAPNDPAADAAFIADMSVDAPRLLATLDARDAVIARLRAWVIELCHDGKDAREALGAEDGELMVAAPARRVAANLVTVRAENARLKAAAVTLHKDVIGPLVAERDRLAAEVAKLRMERDETRAELQRITVELGVLE